MKLNLENRSQELMKAKLFYLGILTIICLVLWIGVSINATFSKTTVDPKINALIKPLNPVLDNDALTKYESTRIAAPDQFQIIVKIKNKDNSIETKIIDPFNNTQSATQSAESITP